MIMSSSNDDFLIFLRFFAVEFCEGGRDRLVVGGNVLTAVSAEFKELRPEEAILPNRLLSIIHGSFELISLPHYLIIALNRALFLIDPTTMTHYFERRLIIWLCVSMWIVPLTANVILNLFEKEENGGFYLFEANSLDMGTESTGFEFKSALSVIFELAFCITAGLVIVIYVVAIVIHGWKRKSKLRAEWASSEFIRERKQCSDVRVVKEIDSKSIGLCPRRFESCLLAANVF
ncbi:hypothetical protein L596_021890 [Steinernema carpocapsae]|uniref:Uncharacterized protein n=1 Tax=Steinernema carpocapsae TaxID=34508 RepID=A0A4V6A019_STECR|nr:hypothetical protein L596_021890 [Steinernema carpocapsae]